jgi:hypothetical protein
MSPAVLDTPHSSPALPGRLYSPIELAEFFGVHRLTILDWAKRGVIPPGRRFGRRILRWTAADIAPLLADREG